MNFSFNCPKIDTFIIVKYWIKLIIFSLTFFGSLKPSYSQDVHFSQRLAADRQRNVAFTNQYEGNWQAMTIYRQQWQSIGVPFNTSGFFLTKKIHTKLTALDFFAGVTFLNDQSGDAKLNSNQLSFNIGAAYTYGKNIFSLAVSNSFVLKSFSQAGLTFPSQYDRNEGRFNESFDNGENFAGDNLNYYDLGFGLLFERKLNAQWFLRSGFSMLHVNEATESFFDQDNDKNMGYGFQFVADYLYSEYITVEPYLSFYRAKGASETILGSAVIFNASSFGPVNNIAPFLYLRTGVDRLTDAIILGSRADFSNFQVGASYDFNVSELEIASNYRGGFELSLLFTLPEEKLKTKRIPCERY
tara:strand:+ start:4592 stop:5662 length:1071 start_codon:yes stop_codon:yes gene_type:complete